MPDRPFLRTGRRFFSLPIFVKILGISFLVTLLFGGVAFYLIRMGVYRTHYKFHGETALLLASSLGARLDPRLEAQDIPAVDRELNRTIGEFPDIRYIFVQDPDGRIVSHGLNFPKQAPADLVEHRDLCTACHASMSPTEISAEVLDVPSQLLPLPGPVRAYGRQGGLVLEATVPIAEGRAGTVRLGIGDKIIVRELAAITRSLVGSLLLCLGVGLSLALVLAYVLVRPLHSLVHTTNRIRQGDFSARARVFSADEIGGLATAFNQMAEALERYRCAVDEKEAARVALMRKIVRAQEDERKSVARELHDQLGQSLSTALLTLETHRRDCPSPTSKCDRLKEDLRGMIEEVRRLAWNVRPSILDDYGLDSALARYVEEVSARAQIPIDYQCVAPPGSGRLPDEIEVTLYRIAQEGITNVVRHAHATQTSLVLLRQDREVCLIVEDNGQGFDPATLERTPAEGTPESGPRLGILGMRERAALVGGQLAIESEPGKGTVVRVRIPIGGGQRTIEGEHGNSSDDSR